MCFLSNNVGDYNYVAQGKTTIPGVDDGEECQLTDVRFCCTFYSVYVSVRIELGTLFAPQFFL